MKVKTFTYNVNFQPLQTVIRNHENRALYFVSTAYMAEEYYDYNIGPVHWETAVFPYGKDGEPVSGYECSILRCKSFEEAIQNHVQLIAKYSADLKPQI